ncbi:MAG: hypothetical protein HOW97_41355 [Catenulispora sp.]|nr:hypothetical protein [Catenulispora sp.]
MGALLVPLLAVTTTAVGSSGAHAAAKDEQPWVVSLGDSYISGEAGRWAGNTNDDSSKADALGPTAYYDDAGHTAETIPRCHRSQSAEIYIGGTVNGLNLACSGATTSTFTNTDGNFKPGLDFYGAGAKSRPGVAADAGAKQGQALMLQEFAATHKVSMVAVSIGGNDFNFGPMVETCIKDFLTSTRWNPSYCSKDSNVTGNLSAANVDAVTSHIAQALKNVRQAMANAGHADDSYTILVQNYPAPIPNSSGFRYGQSGIGRQVTGGCGFWDKDADWAITTALPTISGAVSDAVARSGLTNVKQLDISSALNGRRLCENTVGLLEERNLTSWKDAGAVDQTEWVDQIRTASAIGSPYYIQESLHPNYWGQLALRNCVRQAYNNGAVRGGSCKIAGSGLDADGEPMMALE